MHKGEAARRNSTYTIISTRQTGGFNDDLTDHVGDTRVSRQWLVTVDWPISGVIIGLYCAHWEPRNPEREAGGSDGSFSPEKSRAGKKVAKFPA